MRNTNSLAIIFWNRVTVRTKRKMNAYNYSLIYNVDIIKQNVHRIRLSKD